MNTIFWKKYVWMLLAICLPMGWVGCSDSDDPVKEVETPDDSEEVQAYQDEKAYANFFAYNAMNDVYLWKQDIADAFNSWLILGDPVEAVSKARYKNRLGEEVDKWTMMTDDYDSMVGGTDGIATGTYGLGLRGYKYVNYNNIICVHVLYTYPNSPAEKAGLKRGDMILQINGENITDESYSELFYSNSIELGLGTFENNEFKVTGEKVSMKAVAMYEDPVILTKVFDCGGKKVGYLVYTSFTFESSQTLYEVCKEFKKEGISELILDLRYNGGGYVFTEEVFASMLAPEAEVKNKSVFQTEIWNDDYMAYYKERGTDLNTYFTTEFKQVHNNKTYHINTSDANLGLTKIYALVGEGSASASEAVLVGLLPYMDIEIIGEQTHGKYCSGIMWKGEEWYQDIVDNYKQNKLDFAEKHPQFADWKKYIKNWGLYVMIATYGDKDGKNPCMPNGLTPDLKIEDSFTEPYPLGDEREAMLHVALTKAGKTDLPARTQSRSAVSLPFGHEIRMKNNPLDGKLIHTRNFEPRVKELR